MMRLVVPENECTLCGGKGHNAAQCRWARRNRRMHTLLALIAGFIIGLSLGLRYWPKL